MKRKEFIRELQRAGCYLLRPGARHDLYMNPRSLGKKLGKKLGVSLPRNFKYLSVGLLEKEIDISRRAAEIAEEYFSDFGRLGSDS